MGRKSFSEYVSPGHPDKLADYISEYLLNKYLEFDSSVRYAVEVLVKGHDVVLGGEVTSTHNFSVKELDTFVREAINEIGYTPEYAKKWGAKNTISSDNIRLFSNISHQSADISQGVDAAGWGDQGIFFGYADYDGDKCLMPQSHSYACALCNHLYSNALTFGIGGLDIKTEIIMDGDKVEKVIAAVPCRTDEEYMEIEKEIRWFLRKEGIDYRPKLILNGTGNYKMHGPIADCGITGRKLAVDFYSGACPIGGGSPWTKDGSKADLTLNLLARCIAKGKARELKKSIRVELACCIGKNIVDYQILEPCGDILESGEIKASPADIKEIFGLTKPIFTSACKFGLFGQFQRDKAWEDETIYKKIIKSQFNNNE